MPTIADLIARVSLLLQDTTHDAWLEATIRVQLAEEIAQLARQQLFGLIVWQQGVSGTARYTFADTTVEFAEVLYNGRGLKPAQEEHLTRYQREWETKTGTPQFYTRTLDPPQTVRLVPIPAVTGDDTPVVPMLPISNSEVNNLVAYLWANPQEDTEQVALMAVLEDVVVYRAVATLKGHPGEYGDVMMATCYKQMADLMVQQLLA